MSETQEISESEVETEKQKRVREIRELFVKRLALVAQLSQDLGQDLSKNTAIITGPKGILYIADPKVHEIRTYNPDTEESNIIAGFTGQGFNGDGQHPLDTLFDTPRGIAVGPHNRIYVSDQNNNRVRVIFRSKVRTIAGTGEVGYSGDGHRGTKAELNQPGRLFLHPDGTLYIDDQGNSQIRAVSATGIITTVPTTPLSYKLYHTAKLTAEERQAFFDNGAPESHADLDKTLSSTVKRSKRRLLSQLDAVNHQLITRNIGLVRDTINPFFKFSSAANRTEYAAVGDGGLMKAVYEFDVSRGTAWSSFASMYIRGEIIKQVGQTEHANMDAADFQLRPTVDAAYRELQSELDREPTDEEVAIRSTQKRANHKRPRPVSVEHVAAILRPPNLVPTSTPLSGEDGADTVGDQLVYTGTETEEGALERINKDVLEQALQALDPRELFVIIRRFALDGEPKMNHSTIAVLFNISRETARKIEAKALAKLSHPSVLGKLMYPNTSGG